MKAKKKTTAVAIIAMAILAMAVGASPASANVDVVKAPGTATTVNLVCENDQFIVASNGDSCGFVDEIPMPSTVTCAFAAVTQGAAEAYNGDCILLPRQSACLDYSWHFEYFNEGGYGASWLAKFNYVRYLDIVPDITATVNDLGDLHTEIPDGGFGGARAQEPKIEEGGGLACHASVITVQETTAIAQGAFHQWWCDIEGDCFSTQKVPYNEEKAPGSIIGTG